MLSNSRRCCCCARELSYWCQMFILVDSLFDIILNIYIISFVRFFKCFFFIRCGWCMRILYGERYTAKRYITYWVQSNLIYINFVIKCRNARSWYYSITSIYLELLCILWYDVWWFIIIGMTFFFCSVS